MSPVLLLLLTACESTSSTTPTDDELIDLTEDCAPVVAQGWTEESHAKGVDGLYDQVFDDSRVLRVDVTLCPSVYEAMQADIEDLLGSSGGGGGGPGGGGPGGGGPGGGGDFTDEDPIYVPAHVQVGDQVWPYVGMRYKGNSSLSRAWSAGSLKLPFRFNLDHFEDEVPEIDDQRFFGFKELKFNSAFDDASLVRDKVTADLFRAAGIPAAKGAFAEVYVDAGDGPVFWGVYNLFEEPCDELPEAWFGDGDGDCYKADGDAADLTAYDPESFENKSNDDSDDAVLQALIAALDAGDIDALEGALDVEGYLRYQALNGLIGSWDSYGKMTHNYYLYGDPAADGQLSWMPWDFNEAFRRTSTQEPLSIDLDEVTDAWPLIRQTQDDPQLRAIYLEELADLMDGVFAADAVRERFEAAHELVAPYAALEEAPYSNLSSAAAFEGALTSSNDGVLTVAAAGREEAEALLGR